MSRPTDKIAYTLSAVSNRPPYWEIVGWWEHEPSLEEKQEAWKKRKDPEARQFFKQVISPRFDSPKKVVSEGEAREIHQENLDQSR